MTIWYHANGTLTPQQVIDDYWVLAARMLGLARLGHRPSEHFVAVDDEVGDDIGAVRGICGDRDVDRRREACIRPTTVGRKTLAEMLRTAVTVESVTMIRHDYYATAGMRRASSAALSCGEPHQRKRPVVDGPHRASRRHQATHPLPVIPS